MMIIVHGFVQSYLPGIDPFSVYNLSFIWCIHILVWAVVSTLLLSYPHQNPVLGYGVTCAPVTWTISSPPF